jgi:hypothetical protein
MITPNWITFEQAVDEIKAEIVVDVVRGTVPRGCESLDDISEYVNTEMYGSALDHPTSEAENEFWTAVRERVDQWIKDGGLL